jgi:cell division protein FtsL
MDILLGLIVAVVVVALLYISREPKKLDVNNDGKIDLKDAEQIVENVKEEIKEVAKKTRKPRTTTVKTTTSRGRKPRKV